MIFFIKNKTPQERAEMEGAKLQRLRYQIQQQKAQSQLKTTKEQARNAELRRLRA